MAVMAYLLKEYANEEIDIAKVMIMCLIHDIVEIDAGDTYAYDTEGLKTQKDREDAAKERIFSFRNSEHAWEPKKQRPEMWKAYNTQIKKGESMRVFPISNWTEKDIWQYIRRERSRLCPCILQKSVRWCTGTEISLWWMTTG